MSQRQRRRRAAARLFAQADGRTWQTGQDADRRRALEASRERRRQVVNRQRRADNLTPLHGYLSARGYLELPSERLDALLRQGAGPDLVVQESRERYETASRAALRRSGIFTNARLVGLPETVVSTFRIRDI